MPGIVNVDQLLGLPADEVCEPSFDELREVLEPHSMVRTNGNADRPSRPAEPYAIPRLSIGELVKAHPRLRREIIAGLVRLTESMNVVAVSKTGKSFLMAALAIAVAAGLKWLGMFQCVQGRVLLIDNELHIETICHRLQLVAKAMGVNLGDISDYIHVVSLRGKNITLEKLGRVFDTIERGEYVLVIGDAWYRFYPQGTNENDNSGVMSLYNMLDHYMAEIESAWAGVHHASKGSQADKSVIDVGAGAGSQSRAADTHLIMRPHEEDGVVVVEAAVRSFKPLQPFCLKWEFPLWTPADELDPTLLKGRKSKDEEKQSRRDAEADQAVLSECQTWKSMAQIRRATGMGEPRIAKAVKRLKDAHFLEADNQNHNGNPTEVFRKTIHAK